MDERGDDFPEYPGSTLPALKVDFAQLDLFAGKLGVRVTTHSGGSYFSPTLRLINIDSRTPSRRGFVSVGQLTDEYLHAWNQRFGRGRFLEPRAAGEHRSFGARAERDGTRSLGRSGNAAFHKLEALNFVQSGHDVPGFIWRTPMEEVRRFAFAWEQHFA